MRSADSADLARRLPLIFGVVKSSDQVVDDVRVSVGIGDLVLIVCLAILVGSQHGDLGLDSGRDETLEVFEQIRLDQPHLHWVDKHRRRVHRGHDVDRGIASRWVCRCHWVGRVRTVVHGVDMSAVGASRIPRSCHGRLTERNGETERFFENLPTDGAIYI